MRKIAFFLTLILLVSGCAFWSVAEALPKVDQVKIMSVPFRKPTDLHYDLDGQRILVADAEQHAIYSIDLKTNRAEVVAGMPNKLDPYGNPQGGRVDGDIKVARFDSPRGIAVTESGAILVADTNNHCIRQIYKGKVTTIAGKKEGNKDGSRQVAAFSYPTDVAVDAFGYIYVADAGNDVIRRIHHDGTVSTLKVAVKHPQGLIGAGQYLYISDTGNHRILLYNVKTEEVIPIVPPSNGGFINGSTNRAQFNAPIGLCLAEDDLLVADTLNHSVRRVLNGGKVGVKTMNVETLLGGRIGYDSTSTGGVLMDTPSAVLVAKDKLYVADTLNGRIVVYSGYSKRQPSYYMEKSNTISIYVDGVNLDLREIPVIVEKGTTYLPVRVIGEFLGAEITWVQKDQSVIATRKGMQLKLESKNGTIRFVNGVSYIPLRKFAESFGIKVDWLQEYRAILLKTF